MKHAFFFGKLSALVAVGWLVVGLQGCGLGGEYSPLRRGLTEDEKAVMAYDGSEVLRFKIYDDMGEVTDTMTFTAPLGLQDSVIFVEGIEEADHEHESLYIRFEAMENPSYYFSVHVAPKAPRGLDYSMEILYKDEVVYSFIHPDGGVSQLGYSNYSTDEGILSIFPNNQLAIEKL